MKRIAICLLLFAALGPMLVHAQKVKKDGLGYYNYFQPRASTELDEAKVYFLKVDISDGDAYRRSMFEEQLEIDKFTMAGAEDEHDFTINIVESPMKYGTASRKSYSEKYKSGDVEKSRTVYYYAGSITYQYILKVLNKDGEEIFRKIVGGTTPTKGRTSTSQSTAHNYYVKDKLQFKENAVKGSADKISEHFNEQYTDVEQTIHVRIAYVKDGKYDYPGFAAAIEDLKKAYDLLNGNNGMPLEAEEALKRCLVFWPEFLKESDPENKKARVNAEVTAAAYYCLGLSHFLAENWEDANSNFELAASHDKGVVPGIQNWAYISRQCADREANR